MKIHIIYRNFFLPDGSGMSIGGIQTYLTNLSELFIEMGNTVNIYQRSDIEFEKNLSGNLTVFGFKRDENKVKGTPQYLFSRASRFIDSEHDILVFGCESMVVPTNGIKTIAIQHGISWDIPETNLSPFKYPYRYAKKQYDAFMTARRIRKVSHLVCVDCNFINWYRALVPNPKVNIHYIPNFSVIPADKSEQINQGDDINIIFARRFEPQRGTRLFANVITHIIEQYPHVHVTIAGDGTDEAYFHNRFDGNDSVSITRYSSADSLKIHQKHHIAVVPTLGSEGTSLSLLEAMAAGCAVVCTNVGGMTNIVIDNFNGRLISPSYNELYAALKDLLDNPDKIGALGIMAHKTVEKSFSLELWQNKWKDIINTTTGV